MSRRNPTIEIQRFTASSGEFLRGLGNVVDTTLDASALVPPQAGDHLARPVSRAAADGEHAYRCGVEIVVGPVVALLHAEGGLGSGTVRLWLGQQLCGPDNILLRHAGDLLGNVQA